MFAFLWAGAALFHRAQYAHWAGSPLELAESFCALLVLLRPSSLPAFLGLVVLQLAQNTVLLPHVSNHTLLLWFMSLSIMLSAIVLAARGTLGRAGLYQSFAPALRLELLLLYFWVVFQKLNPDFFDAPISCAGNLLDKLGVMLGLGALPVFARGLAVWGTLLTEAAIPLLLIPRRTRWMGIGLGLLFHFGVGLALFFDFSSLLFACYALFAPEALPERLARLGRRIGEGLGMPRTSPWWASGLLGAGLLVGVLVLLAESWSASKHLAWLLWWVWGIGAIALFAAVTPWRETGLARAGAMLDLRPRWLLIVPALVFLNGASPHLGFKTEHSFAMFSNLRTEGGESNHLLIPASLQVFDYQRDLVRVTASSDPALRRRTRFSGLMPWAELRSHVSAAAARGERDIRIQFERDGERVDIDAAERHPELSRPHRFPLSKLLWFREIVSDRTRQFCRH